MPTETSPLDAALAGIDAESIEVCAGRVELRFNSRENSRHVNTVVVSPAGKDPFTGEDTYNVSAFRIGHHFGRVTRLASQAKGVFACSLREVIESQVWS